MSVTQCHPSYIDWKPRWQRIRDAVSGRWTVAKRGELYLPKLTGQTDAEYEAYKNRARWYAAPSRVTSALVGTALIKPPMITVEKELEILLHDCDGQGTTLNTYIARLVAEVVMLGRTVIRVDMLDDRRPILLNHSPEMLINWKTDGIVLHTCDEVESEDWFSHTVKDRYRVLRMLDKRLTFVMFDENGDILEDSVSDPKMKGGPVNFLPVVVPSPTDLTFDIDPSPLEPIVDLAYNYWMLSADYFHGLHFVGLPTPYVTGISATDDLPTQIGPTAIWALPMNCTVGLLEFQGQGLTEISNAMATTVQAMSELGSRILQPPMKSAESENTVAMKASADSSSLSSIVSRIAEAMTVALRMAHDWSGIQTKDVTCKMSTDFLPRRLEGDALRSIVDSWVKGALTKEDLFVNLTEGNIVHESDYDVWAKSLDETQASMGGAMPPVMPGQPQQPKPKAQPKGAKGIAV